MFKGGTSLSKVYNAIQRFSEDIDLIMDWRLLGIGEPEKDPWDLNRSRTKQDQFNRALGPATQEYLQDALVPFLRSQLPSLVEVVSSAKLDQGVEIRYPAVYKSDYIPDSVLLEIGPLASWVPSTWRSITSEVSRHFPKVLGDFMFPVCVTTAERSFWEKATIAHQIACSGKSPPKRYARHYYDIVMLTRAGVAERAMKDMPLLRSVAEFKERFYPSRLARYDLAAPGTFRIVPDADQLTLLAKDYQEMRAMFYGAPPEWKRVVDELYSLERQINSQDSRP